MPKSANGGADGGGRNQGSGAVEKGIRRLNRPAKESGWHPASITVKKPNEVL